MEDRQLEPICFPYSAKQQAKEMLQKEQEEQGGYDKVPHTFFHPIILGI